MPYFCVLVCILIRYFVIFGSGLEPAFLSSNKFIYRIISMEENCSQNCPIHSTLLFYFIILFSQPFLLITGISP